MGLDVTSADMCLCKTAQDAWFLYAYTPGEYDAHTVPAWSLTALLEVMPPFIKGHHLKIEKTRITDMWYLDYQYLTDSEPRKDLLTAAYEMVCWLLENNLIKKGDNDD